MKVIFEVISGHAGPCLSIGNGDSGHRLSGPKPLGGGSVIHSFNIDADELQRELNALTKAAPQPVQQEPKKWIDLTSEEYEILCQGSAPLNMRVRTVAIAVKNKNHWRGE